MACTGRPGAPVDSDPEQTKELADKIRDVVGNTAITFTAAQLVDMCQYAGIVVYLEKSVTANDAMQDLYTLETNTNIPGYTGLSIHITDAPEIGYMALEPDKCPHQVEREAVVSAMPVPK